MIRAVSLNPSIDKSLEVDEFVFWDINRVRRACLHAGGKGTNVARFVHRLGGAACVYGFIGGDTGEQYLKLLSKEGVREKFTRVGGDTRLIINVFDRKKRREIRINENGPAVSRAEINSFLQSLLKDIRQGDFVSMSGSLPPGVPRGIYADIVRKASALGARCSVDCDGNALTDAAKQGVYLVKPNRFEIGRLFGVHAPSKARTVELGRRLRRLGAKNVIVSDGANEAVCMTEDGTFAVKPPSVKVKSTIGAGDSMVAAILHCLGEGGNFKEALRFGTAVAAAQVMTPGTEPFSPATATKLCRRVEVRPMSGRDKSHPYNDVS